MFWKSVVVVGWKFLRGGNCRWPRRHGKNLELPFLQPITKKRGRLDCTVPVPFWPDFLSICSPRRLEQAPFNFDGPEAVGAYAIRIETRNGRRYLGTQGSHIHPPRALPC